MRLRDSFQCCSRVEIRWRHRECTNLGLGGEGASGMAWLRSELLGYFFGSSSLPLRMTLVVDAIDVCGVFWSCLERSETRWNRGVTWRN